MRSELAATDLAKAWLRLGAGARVPGCDSTGAAKKSNPALEVRVGGREELPQPEARGGGGDEQPHIQGAVAASTGGPRGVTPRPRSGALAGRSYPTSKERWL